MSAGAATVARPESRTRWLWLLFAMAVILLLGASWIVRDLFFERVEVEEPTPPSGEALINAHLALEELLIRSGLPARRASSLEAFPPSDGVLWWLAPTRRLSPERLLSWVEGGGHLILEPLPGFDELVDTAGIAVFSAEQADDDDHLSEQEFQIERPPWPKFYLPQEETEIVAVEGAADAAWNLTVAYGEGLVTVLNSSSFLTNDQIAKMDHALLAWHLVRADEGRTGVTLVTRDPKPSVWLILGRRAQPAAVSLVVISILGLWGLARRVGPVLPSPSRDRRHLAEHLRASGEFFWRVGCEEVLLEAQRGTVLDELHRGRGGLGGRLDDRGTKLMAEVTPAARRAGIEPEAVKRALQVKGTRDRDHFVGTVRILEALRRGRGIGR
ncbi:MAG: DUF4350 domain-containing protein [Thermoanaerobaculia bacterium]|nr:DUF4350 domain-containing protein [Thermoanaerobaculia bacterium]